MPIARLGAAAAPQFISEELSRDPDALSRFAREAQAASALNHANICTIHDVGEQDGRSFIVMEYLEGTTLDDRLAAGSMPLNTVLDVGIQIADALDAAHAAGIVHRDIKPANVFIGSRDHVKVLDFGLAKMRVPATRQADVTTIAGTQLGVVMGTVAYMAPEQASGERSITVPTSGASARSSMKWPRGRGPRRVFGRASRARRSWNASSRNASLRIASSDISRRPSCEPISRT